MGTPLLRRSLSCTSFKGISIEVSTKWNSLGYLGGLALLTARNIDTNWSRVKVFKLCLPKGGSMLARMQVIAQ